MTTDPVRAVRVNVTVSEDGKIALDGLPFKKGDELEMILFTSTAIVPRYMTAGDLLASDLIGMWADRSDIGDSVEFARKLREAAQHRDLGID